MRMALCSFPGVKPMNAIDLAPPLAAEAGNLVATRGPASRAGRAPIAEQFAVERVDEESAMRRVDAGGAG